MVAERDAKASVQNERMAKMQAELDEMRRLMVTINRPTDLASDRAKAASMVKSDAEAIAKLQSQAGDEGGDD
jgi:hypothetical protein